MNTILKTNASKIDERNSEVTHFVCFLIQQKIISAGRSSGVKLPCCHLLVRKKKDQEGVRKKVDMLLLSVPHLFLIDVRLTHTNTRTRTHTEIKATQAGVQQIKRTATQTQTHVVAAFYSFNLEGKNTEGFMSFC